MQCFVRSLTSADDVDAQQTVLFISGSPGTGKTALVNSVLGDMQSELADAVVNIISVNCMALNNVDALWDRLLEALGTGVGPSKVKKSKVTPYQALNKLLMDMETKR